MPSGLPYGSASGMLYQRIPRAVRSAYAIPYLASEIRNYDQRYFVAARLALAARVSYIGTPNPSTLIRLAETGASCVFVEPQVKPALAETLVRGTGARLAALDPMGAGLDPGPMLYENLMVNLAESLLGCLTKAG